MVCWSELVSKSFSTRATQRIAKEMPHREITLCEDETFHPQICLVAIEPVSNYLILEEYAAKRDAPTWNVAISEALKPFSITVIQCVSDLATALISHAEIHLGVHHSPDLFHVQHDTSKATSVSLIRQTEKAEKTLKAADDSYLQVAKQLQDFNENWPNLIKKLAQAQEKLNSHFDTLEQVASEAGLKSSSIARLAKAKRVLPSMSGRINS